MKNNLIIGIFFVLILVFGLIYLFPSKKLSNLVKFDSFDFSRRENSIVYPTGKSNDLANFKQKTFLIVSGESKAVYEINEDLKGKSTHVIGVSDNISGTINLDVDLKNVNDATVVVDANTFKTDIEMRDINVKKLVLKSDLKGNESVVFKTTKIEGVSEKNEMSKDMSLKITGDMTIMGITKEVVFTGTITSNSDNTLFIKANTTISYEDFGIVIPNLPFLSFIDKKVQLSVELIAR